jgi:cell wall-associated NlpC family hydrolase
LAREKEIGGNMTTPFNPVVKDGVVYSDQWELAARERIVIEARSWISTPFHHEARVKGPEGGIDCAMFLAEVYERAGQIPHLTPEHYPHDWHLHKDEERYLAWVMLYARDVTQPLMGDVVMFKIGRAYSHGGVIVKWPWVVHAWHESCVEETDSSINPILFRAPKKFFTLRQWK